MLGNFRVEFSQGKSTQEDTAIDSAIADYLRDVKATKGLATYRAYPNSSVPILCFCASVGWTTPLLPSCCPSP